MRLLIERLSTLIYSIYCLFINQRPISVCLYITNTCDLTTIDQR